MKKLKLVLNTFLLFANEVNDQNKLNMWLTSKRTLKQKHFFVIKWHYLIRVSNERTVVRRVRNSVVVSVVIASIADTVVIGVFLPGIRSVGTIVAPTFQVLKFILRHLKRWTNLLYKQFLLLLIMFSRKITRAKSTTFSELLKKSRLVCRREITYSFQAQTR